jgi:hypothetical protein
MNKTKKGIVVCLLAAALLVSMVGMASAEYLSTDRWRMTNELSGVNGADYIMYQVEAAGSSVHIQMDNVTNVTNVWNANYSASVGTTFSTGNWTGAIDFTATDPLCDGESIKFEIGSLNSSDGTFTSAGSITKQGQGTTSCVEAWTPISVNIPSFTVPSGHYLAFKLTMISGDVEVETNGGAESDSHGEYPYPELSTIVLFSTGLLALAGYVGYRRRNNKSE